MKHQINQLTAAFERLSVREQRMVLFVVVALSAMALGGSSYFVRKDLKSTRQRIAHKEEKLREIAEIRGDYHRQLSEQNRLAEEVKRNEKTRILSYLEELSRAANIELGNASERAGGSTGSGLVREEAAQVEVKNVSLDRLYDFLKRIEQGNRLVKVRRLRVRTRFDNKEMLDASIMVGTFKPTKT